MDQPELYRSSYPTFSTSQYLILVSISATATLWSVYYNCITTLVMIFCRCDCFSFCIVCKYCGTLFDLLKSFFLGGINKCLLVINTLFTYIWAYTSLLFRGKCKQNIKLKFCLHFHLKKVRKGQKVRKKSVNNQQTLLDLTQCIQVDSSTVICWKSLFIILGASGLFCHDYSIFNEKSC